MSRCGYVALAVANGSISTRPAVAIVNVGPDNEVEAALVPEIPGIAPRNERHALVGLPSGEVVACGSRGFERDGGKERAVETVERHVKRVYTQLGFRDIGRELHVHALAKPHGVSQSLDVLLTPAFVSHVWHEFVVRCPRLLSLKGQSRFKEAGQAVADGFGALRGEYTAVHEAIAVDELALEAGVFHHVLERADVVVGVAAHKGGEALGVLEAPVHVEEHNVELAVGTRTEAFQVVIVANPVGGTDICHGEYCGNTIRFSA